MSRLVLLIVSIAVFAAADSAVQADVVRLTNGGELRGLLKGDRKGATIELQTLFGGTIRVERTVTTSIVRRTSTVEEYVSRSREIPNTVDAHWELAEWCRENRILPQREEQLEAIVLLDPEHPLARRGLTHVRYKGEWMTRDASMRAQGYVKHKGRYITQQELDLLDKTGAQREAELKWYPKIRQWQGWLVSDNPHRQQDGLAEIQAVIDPDAIPAMADFLGKSPEPDCRKLLVERLRAISGEKPVRTLVQLSLFEDVEPIRQAAFQALKKDQYDKAVPYYADALTDETNLIVQRAASALGTVGDERVVPALIRALITEHKVTINVPISDTSTTVSRNPNGSYSIGGTGVALPANVAMLLRTGQLPYGVRYRDPSAGYRQVTTRVEIRNEQVLEALKKLTSKDFGYDPDAWQLYWAARRSRTGTL